MVTIMLHIPYRGKKLAGISIFFLDCQTAKLITPYPAIRYIDKVDSTCHIIEEIEHKIIN